MSEMNCKSQTVFLGDNLDIMRGLNRRIADAIITDPPFNSNRRHNHNFGTPPKTKSGQPKPGFDDAWTMDDLRAEEHELLHEQEPDLYHLCALARKMHSPGMQAYLIMMATRLLQCHELLKETGSLFLHCDPTANAYLRMMLDSIFGKQNFRNEIIWHYRRWTNASKAFQRMHDSILFYAKSEKAKFNIQTELTAHKIKVVNRGWDSNVVRDGKLGKVRQLLVYNAAKAAEEMKKSKYDRIVMRDKVDPGSALPSVWIDIPYLASGAKERSGWGTQKPVELYSRMILASTNAGDVVLDPFCGCATTLVAAENAGRQWIGIDRDQCAGEMVVQQLTKLNEGSEDWLRKVIVRDDLPVRTDAGKIPHYSKHKTYLYEKQHGKCAGCGYPKESFALEIDHDIPRSKGGTDHISNLQLLCSRCNRRKGTDRLKHLRAKLRKEGLLYEQRNDF